MTNTNKILKPCRTCGSNWTALDVIGPAAHINDYWWVRCDNCDAESMPCVTEEDMILNWNEGG